MGKAIVITDGEHSFLAEVDDKVTIPTAFRKSREAAGAKKKGVPKGMRPVVSAGDVERHFNEIKELIVTSCNGLFDALSSIPEPSKSSAQFGIKLAGETGFPVLAKASGEASITVTIEWSK